MTSLLGLIGTAIPTNDPSQARGRRAPSLQLLRQPDSSETNLMDSRQRDSRSVVASNVLRRRRFLVLLGVSLGSVGSVACGGGGGALATPTPFAFPGTKEGHDACVANCSGGR